MHLEIFQITIIKYTIYREHGNMDGLDTPHRWKILRQDLVVVVSFNMRRRRDKAEASDLPGFIDHARS